MNGIILGNRYELLEKIGEGGMSLVFKARCNKLNRFVAVKILKKEFCNNADIVEKFKGEATAIATLSDNNIVNILDVGTQGDMNYIVMEYVDGKTLKDVIKQVGKMNYETAISVAIQIAKALDCAHRNKIIHRDVKPQNILVTSDGVMKVTDFGIAKSTTSSTITNTSTIMGSAHYLSPEQAKGSFIDCRTDLYSLGVVIYEMVTGALPFEADTAVTIALKHLQEEVVPPKNINSKIPDSLNKLILKAMQKDPNKRYQSAKEMIRDLQKIKDNPDVIIDGVDEDENQNTIIMPAVTQEIKKVNDAKTTSSYLNNDDYEDDDYEEYEDDDYEDEKPSKLKGKLPKILSICGGVILAIILIFSAVKLFSSVDGKEVEVPNIVGTNIEDAKKKLEALNLVLVEAGKEQSDEEEGTITQSNPEAGTKVKEKSEIRVIVSSGANKIKMPGLEEYDLATAKKILESLGIKNIETVEEYSSNISKGKIISQNPEEDSDISENDTVTLTISKGYKPQEVKYTTVPSVAGMSESEARNKIQNQGLNVVSQEKNVSDESQDGKVLYQSIEGTARQGATVTITVGKYVKNEPSKIENNTNNDSSNNTNNSTNHNNTTNNNSSNNDSSNNNTVKPGESNETENRPAGPWDDEEPAENNDGPSSEETSNNE